MLVRILLLLVLITWSSGLDENLFINSALAIKNHFRCGCIYLINFSDNELFQSFQSAKEIFKNYIALGVWTSSWLLKSLQGFRCKQNAPLIIVYQRERNVQDFLRKISLKVHMTTARWLFLLVKNTDFQEFFADINIPFNCEFLIAQSEDDQILLTEVYRVGPTLPLQTYHFGKWSPTEGLKLSGLNFYERRNNLLGFEMKTGIRQDMFTELIVRPNGMSFSDLFGELWDILETEMNFTSKYLLPGDDDTGGDKTRNGTWTGVFGMFQRKEIEVSNAPFSMTSKRMEVVDFSLPVIDIKTYIVIKKPRAYELKWIIFLMPFNKNSWTAIVVTMSALAVVFKLFDYVQRYSRISRNSRISYVDAILIVITAFCQQGLANIPKNSSLRLVFATLYLTAFVILTCFSAAFITQMTLRRPQLPFTNFEEFLGDGSYRLGLLKKSAQMDYFKKSNVTLLQQIYNKMIAPYETGMDVNDKDGLQRVCNSEKYAYMLSTFSLMKKIYQPDCNIVIIPQAYYPGTLAISMAKSSPYSGLMNYKLQSLKNNKKLKELYQKYFFKIPIYEEDRTLAVNLYDAAPILITLAIGIVIALVVFLAELIFYSIECK